MRESSDVNNDLHVDPGYFRLACFAISDSIPILRPGLASCFAKNSRLVADDCIKFMTLQHTWCCNLSHARAKLSLIVDNLITRIWDTCINLLVLAFRRKLLKEMKEDCAMRILINLRDFIYVIAVKNFGQLSTTRDSFVYCI